MSSEADWIEVYRQTIQPLYAYVSRWVGGDRELAEDVTQETWLRALVEWPRRGWPADPLAWLKTVARNLLRNSYRRKAPACCGTVELNLTEESLVPETPEAATLVHWGLARLRRRDANLLEAFHFEGKSVRAMALAAGLTERAIEGRLRRARQALRQRLVRFVLDGKDES